MSLIFRQGRWFWWDRRNISHQSLNMKTSILRYNISRIQELPGAPPLDLYKDNGKCFDILLCQAEIFDGINGCFKFTNL